MKTILKIYKAVSGQWSGVVFEDDNEVARVAGCSTADDVEIEALEQWRLDEVIYPEGSSSS